MVDLLPSSKGVLGLLGDESINLPRAAQSPSHLSFLGPVRGHAGYSSQSKNNASAVLSRFLVIFHTVSFITQRILQTTTNQLKLNE
jgi:hypothetical protein